MSFLLIPLMSFLARLSGSSYLQEWLGITPNTFWESFFKRVPEIIFGLIIGCVSGYLNSWGWYWWILASVWSFVAMETGHGTFYKMIGYDDHNRPDDEPDKPRVQTLEKIFRPLFLLFKGDINNPSYSWFMMSIKGGLIAFPLGALPVILNAILWPTAYWIGHRKLNSPKYAEWISGAFIGLILGIYILI